MRFEIANLTALLHACLVLLGGLIPLPVLAVDSGGTQVTKIERIFSPECDGGKFDRFGAAEF